MTNFIVPHCLSCQQAGGCSLSTSQAVDHYEAHITIEEAPVQEFREICKANGLKPILLDLHLSAGGIMKDMMTSSKFTGSYDAARAYIVEKANALTAAGYDVVRLKLETTPWNPLTPSRTAGVLAGEGYFESHLPVITTADRLPELRAIAIEQGMHLSRNAFKRHSDDRQTVMLTKRSYTDVQEDFETAVYDAEATLKAAGFEVEKVIIEYAIYDTKVDHDRAWTELAA